jgi:hypothetical protein
MGVEITYYDEDATVIYHDAMTLPADGTFTTDEATNLRLPKKGTGNVVLYWQEETITGNVAYHFNQRQIWAWDHGEITYQSHNAYPSHEDGYQQYFGIAGHDSGNPGPGCQHGPRPEAGVRECHYSWYQGHFCNDIPVWGCLSHTYPEVKIYIDGWGGASGCSWENAGITASPWVCRELQ